MDRRDLIFYLFLIVAVEIAYASLCIDWLVFYGDIEAQSLNLYLEIIAAGLISLAIIVRSNIPRIRAIAIGFFIGSIAFLMIEIEYLEQLVTYEIMLIVTLGAIGIPILTPLILWLKAQNIHIKSSFIKINI